VTFGLYEIGFDGKVYGLFMGESSILIIVDNELFEYIQKLIREGADYRPIDLEEIIKEYS
jgi:hypothetical protein